MIEQPLISIVVPVYNVLPYLKRCIESIINQTYRNIEILLIDDGSTDDSGKICDEYEKQDIRVRTFHKCNGGLSDARNYGIEKANGKYISFIDSDDYIAQDYIEYLYSLIIKFNCNMSLCTHYVYWEDKRIKVIGNCSQEKLDAKSCLERMLYHDVIDTSAWGKLYHISLFENITYPKGKIFEDIATTYRLFLLSGNVACGYEPKYFYMMRKNSIVTNEFKLNKLDLITFTDEMACVVEKTYTDLHRAVIRRQVYARFSTLNQMLNTNEYPNIRNELVEFIRNNRWEVLINKKANIRDKIAIILLMFGYPIYKLSWKIYER